MSPMDCVPESMRLFSKSPKQTGEFCPMPCSNYSMYCVLTVGYTCFGRALLL